MRRYYWAFIALSLFMFAFAPSAYATSSTSGSIMLGAEVDGTLSMTIVLKKNYYGGDVVTSMDFGRLVDIGTKTLRSSPTSTTGTGAIAAFIYITSFSNTPYTLTQTGTLLTKATGVSLPAGACTVVPLYVDGDNGGVAKPGDAYPGSMGTWVATDKLLYYSGAQGLSRCVTAYYSITDDTAAGATSFVPLNQAGGEYSGMITFTATQ